LKGGTDADRPASELRTHTRKWEKSTNMPASLA
jgi:hypothetical protein